MSSRENQWHTVRKSVPRDVVGKPRRRFMTRVSCVLGVVFFCPPPNSLLHGDITQPQWPAVEGSRHLLTSSTTPNQLRYRATLRSLAGTAVDAGTLRRRRGLASHWPSVFIPTSRPRNASMLPQLHSRNGILQLHIFTRYFRRRREHCKTVTRTISTEPVSEADLHIRSGRTLTSVVAIALSGQTPMPHLEQ